MNTKDDPLGEIFSLSFLLSPFSEELMNEVLRPLEEEGYLISNLNLDRSEGVALNGREISMLRISYQLQRLAYQFMGSPPRQNQSTS